MTETAGYLDNIHFSFFPTKKVSIFPTSLLKKKTKPSPILGGGEKCQAKSPMAQPLLHMCLMAQSLTLRKNQKMLTT